MFVCVCCINALQANSGYGVLCDVDAFVKGLAASASLMDEADGDIRHRLRAAQAGAAAGGKRRKIVSSTTLQVEAISEVVSTVDLFLYPHVQEYPEDDEDEEDGAGLGDCSGLEGLVTE